MKISIIYFILKKPTFNYILWAVEIQFFTRSSIDFILNFAD